MITVTPVHCKYDRSGVNALIYRPTAQDNMGVFLYTARRLQQFSFQEKTSGARGGARAVVTGALLNWKCECALARGD